MAHLSDLLIDEELQVISFLVLKVLCQLSYLLLQVFIGFLDVADLLAEEFSFLGELFLCCELARQSVMQELDEHLSEFFDVIYEHDVAELLFLFDVAAVLRQVVCLVALNARLRAILGATESLCEHLIEGLEMVLDSLVLFRGVVLCKLIQIVFLDELWKSLTRMNVLVDLHEDVFGIGYLRTTCHLTDPAIGIVDRLVHLRARPLVCKHIAHLWIFSFFLNDRLRQCRLHTTMSR